MTPEYLFSSSPINSLLLSSERLELQKMHMGMAYFPENIAVIRYFD